MRKKIYVSSCGYAVGAKKTAVCLTGGDGFVLENVQTGEPVYRGRLSPSSDDPESGDVVRIADFSDYDIPGQYCIKCGFRRSQTFSVGKGIYDELKKTVLSGIYLNRCGYDFMSDEKTVGYRRFIHKKCHSGFTPMFFGGQMYDASGGWHCGGGYGKYVNITALACAAMLYGYRLYPESFSDNNGDVPEIISECRWGLEWLLKMQSADGGVYHKCDTALCPEELPSVSSREEEYYVFPESCQAAVLFTAVTALAARVYEEFDRAFAKKLRRAASNSWLWIANSDSYEPWELPTGAQSCGAGDIPDMDNQDDYVWALCELYELTGDEHFHRRFAEMIYYTDTTGFSVNNTGGFAALSYIMGSEKKDQTILFYIKKKFGDRADKLAAASERSGYGSALGAKPNFGGYDLLSNMTVISDCLICQTAYMLFGLKKYIDAASMTLQYLMGKNPLGINYITGVSEDSPHRPRHALSHMCGESVPGMIVCGANYFRNDEFSRWRLGKHTPPAKCYIDNECSASTNEPYISFAAAALMAFAFFDKNGSEKLPK